MASHANALLEAGVGSGRKVMKQALQYGAIAAVLHDEVRQRASPHCDQRAGATPFARHAASAVGSAYS
jgi:hypothetical protein